MDPTFNPVITDDSAAFSQKAVQAMEKSAARCSLTRHCCKVSDEAAFVLFKGLTFQKLCLPGAFRPGITIIKC